MCKALVDLDLVNRPLVSRYAYSPRFLINVILVTFEWKSSFHRIFLLLLFLLPSTRTYERSILAEQSFQFFHSTFSPCIYFLLNYSRWRFCRASKRIAIADKEKPRRFTRNDKRSSKIVNRESLTIKHDKTVRVAKYSNSMYELESCASEAFERESWRDCKANCKANLVLLG